MMEKETLQAEIQRFIEAKEMIESGCFQEFFAKPMKKERDKLRTAFFSDTLKESWRKGGKQEGIEVFMKIVEQVPVDLKNKVFELEQIEDSAKG